MEINAHILRYSKIIFDYVQMLLIQIKTKKKLFRFLRVSFGSSKGSMVETLVFETPTPLPEHAEREFGFPTDQTNATVTGAGKSSTMQNNLCNSSSTCLDDSGIELQEE